MMAVEGNMPATVICFESFRREQVCQRADGLVPESEIVPDRRSGGGSGLYRAVRAGQALSPRQIAHRRAILDYWSQFERLRLTAASTNRSGSTRADFNCE
jgi:hypothetical protein